MLTFFKLLFKFLELWRNISAGTVMAEKWLDSIDELKGRVEELISEMSQGKHSNIGVVSFAIGFSLMMALDVALG